MEILRKQVAIRTKRMNGSIYMKEWKESKKRRESEGSSEEHHYLRST